MREETCHCGNEPELVGIYNHSDNHRHVPDEYASESNTERPVILLLNSGLLPNTGPYRLYVRMARHFSRLGFDSFRFDLSGIGESNRRDDTLPRAQQQIDDIKIIMDSLEESHGRKQFVVMGICTGADNAHRAMVADERIVGAVGIDGYYYATSRYYQNYLFRHLAPRLLRIETWREKIHQLLTAKARRHSQPVTLPFRWEVPAKEKTAADYQLFISRNAHKLCIFTASWPYNYQDQLADAFPQLPIGENVKALYLENAEHMFPLKEDRDQLTNAISLWLKECF